MWFPVIATEMVLLRTPVGNVLYLVSGCISPESYSTRGFRVVVGGILGGLWVFGGILWLVELVVGFWRDPGAC